MEGMGLAPSTAQHRDGLLGGVTSRHSRCEVGPYAALPRDTPGCSGPPPEFSRDRTVFNSNFLSH